MNHPFSDQYIAMAKASEEIQAAQKSFHEGEWFLERGEVRAVAPARATIEAGPDEPEFWLPRLDQLLGMLDTPAGLRSPEWFLARAVGYDDDGEEVIVTFKEAYHSYEDWHELALAVVMREKYGKTWDGKGWVKT